MGGKATFTVIYGPQTRGPDNRLTSCYPYDCCLYGAEDSPHIILGPFVNIEFCLTSVTFLLSGNLIPVILVLLLQTVFLLKAPENHQSLEKHLPVVSVFPSLIHLPKSHLFQLLLWVPDSNHFKGHFEIFLDKGSRTMAASSRIPSTF